MPVEYTIPKQADTDGTIYMPVLAYLLSSGDTPNPVERDRLLGIGGTMTMFPQEPYER